MQSRTKRLFHSKKQYPKMKLKIIPLFDIATVNSTIHFSNMMENLKTKSEHIVYIFLLIVIVLTNFPLLLKYRICQTLGSEHIKDKR